MALQEVRGSDVRAAHDATEGQALFSQEVFPPATLRWMGCGLLIRTGEVLDAGVIGDLPKPQRSLWARVSHPTLGPVTVVSWHAPNRAGDGLEAKMAAFRATSEWLEAAPRPLLIGADLNTWRDPVDLVRPESGEPHFHEHEFVGPGPRHGLTDAYRSVLEHRGRLETLRKEQPDGPLECSHELSNGARHRMDRVYTSAELRPIDGGYLKAESLQAGSDHALHWIDFESDPRDT